MALGRWKNLAANAPHPLTMEKATESGPRQSAPAATPTHTRAGPEAGLQAGLQVGLHLDRSSRRGVERSNVVVYPHSYHSWQFDNRCCGLRSQLACASSSLALIHVVCVEKRETGPLMYTWDRAHPRTDSGSLAHRLGREHEDAVSVAKHDMSDSIERLSEHAATGRTGALCDENSRWYPRTNPAQWHYTHTISCGSYALD